MIHYVGSLRHYKGEDLYLGDLLWLSKQAKDGIIHHILIEYPWIRDPFPELKFLCGRKVCQISSGSMTIWI